MLTLAKNEAKMIESLFNGAGTLSGFVQKIKKRSIDFWYCNAEYTITSKGIIAKRTQKEFGTWYSYCFYDECFGMSNVEANAFIESLSIDKDKRGYIFK